MVGGSLRIRGPRSSLSNRHWRYSHPDEEESLLAPHSVAPHSLHVPHPVLPGYFAPRRDRRALSLELPHVLQLSAGTTHTPPQTHHPVPAVTLPAPHCKKSLSGELVIKSGGDLEAVHQDCNGRTPQSHLHPPPSKRQSGAANPQSHLMTDVFPQVNTRTKDREDLDDDIEYVGELLILYVQKKTN